MFVRLACTPLVYRTRTADGLAFSIHTGEHAEQVLQAWIDEQGQLFIETELGAGVLHDQDLPEVLAHLTGPDGLPLADAAIERLLDEAAKATAPRSVHLNTGRGPVRLSFTRTESLAGRFHFDPDPRPAPGEPEC